MSIIKTLYSEYVEKECEEDCGRTKAMEIAAGIMPKKEYFEFENALMVAEDRATEDAFIAGFKTAIRLIKEALV